ncbi:hypothetical protein EVAR_90654_1 [Eumeta japonica]|uniref:Uncharacterized protein n=1 Tax=Eumeta variegata TaxID=151549 RepID=A0A4C1Z9A0_EUMVA|nr:hypothetical protein EVAR_90654_1 [Eumeta japonica]
MAQRNVRAIRTQTVLPPVLCRRRAYGQLPWMPACSRDPSTREAVRSRHARVSRHSAIARAAAGPRNAPPPQRTLLHPLTI